MSQEIDVTSKGESRPIRRESSDKIVRHIEMRLKEKVRIQQRLQEIEEEIHECRKELDAQR